MAQQERLPEGYTHYRQAVTASVIRKYLPNIRFEEGVSFDVPLGNKLKADLVIGNNLIRLRTVMSSLPEDMREEFGKILIASADGSAAGSRRVNSLKDSLGEYVSSQNSVNWEKACKDFVFPPYETDKTYSCVTTDRDLRKLIEELTGEKIELEEFQRNVTEAE